MATKLSSKPNSKRQFSAPKRTWSVLTAEDPKHVKKLEHIQETLDAALEALQEESDIEDWEDVKNFVESFNKRPDRINESGNQKASVSMDLVTEGKDGEVSGFVFYLTKDPSHRTSGVYLVKNLKQAGVETKDNNNYYTPSQIRDLIGLDSEHLEEDSISEELDEELDSELEDNLSDLEEDDLEELLSDEDDTPLSSGVLGKIAKSRSVQKLNDSSQIEQPSHKQPKAEYPLLDSLETFLKESERQGANIAGMGSEINGLTVSGLTIQTRVNAS
ncbi:MAG: hypothetical protein ACM37W_08300 [Actinomycetota bacterium]